MKKLVGEKDLASNQQLMAGSGLVLNLVHGTPVVATSNKPTSLCFGVFVESILHEHNTLYSVTVLSTGWMPLAYVA